MTMLSGKYSHMHLLNFQLPHCSIIQQTAAAQVPLAGGYLRYSIQYQQILGVGNLLHYGAGKTGAKNTG